MYQRFANVGMFPSSLFLVPASFPLYWLAFGSLPYPHFLTTCFVRTFKANLHPMVAQTMPVTVNNGAPCLHCA